MKINFISLFWGKGQKRWRRKNEPFLIDIF
jgi:hypothetical protein